MMYQRILVPLDGSTLSETALRIALPLARRQRATVEIVHVHELPHLVGLAPMFDTQLDAEVRDSMRSEQRARAQRFSKESGVSVEAVFLEGDVLSALVEYAERTGPDLVVMTTHGRSGLSRLWLGSITDGIARKLRIPVLVTHGEAAGDVEHGSDSGAVDAPMFSRVLVPLDGSANAEAIFPSISALVMPDEVTVALLRVVVAPVQTDPRLKAGVSARSPYLAGIAAAQVEALAYLDDVADSLRAIGIRSTTHVAVHPDPASVILNFASDSPCASGNLVDLIALAPHERTTRDRLLLGSVTDKVLRGATTPVLLHHHAPEAAFHMDESLPKTARQR
jgi:nucleotide-binding universal stress UspA family protein